MQPPRESQVLQKDLLIHWIVFAALLFSLAVYAFIGYILGAPLRVDATTAEPVVLRSVFYALAIVTFPLIQLIRHITLRLNQTMPTPTPAKTRYLISVIISLAMSESIGIYGLVLALLGDSVNGLWIFTFLSALAMLLYRPKLSEYQSIVAALGGEPQHRTHVR
jgi:F0F1-type ATP synthase membrane subunit c/vacuolar-type H+-ATPase subunit K